MQRYTSSDGQIAINVEVRLSRTDLAALAEVIGSAVERGVRQALGQQGGVKGPESASLAEVMGVAVERGIQRALIRQAEIHPTGQTGPSIGPADATGTLDNEDKMLLDTKETARLLGVGRRSIWVFSHSGEIPRSVKIGRMVRWRRDELVAWVDAGCPHYDNWVKVRRR